MIAAVTREVRFLVITAALVATAAIGLYFLGRHIRYALVERPYIAAVKSELRLLAVAQDSFRIQRARYTTDVAAVLSPQNRTTGVEVRILQADSAGFLGEGRHTIWTGWCIVGAGRYLGDSLTAGEPRCHAK
jgi:hypothetical protein